MEKTRQQFFLWCFPIAFLLILAVQNILFAPHPENLAYNDVVVAGYLLGTLGLYIAASLLMFPRAEKRRAAAPPHVPAP